MTRLILLLAAAVAAAQSCQPTPPPEQTTRSTEAPQAILPNDPQEGTFGDPDRVDGWLPPNRAQAHPFTLLPGEEASTQQPVCSPKLDAVAGLPQVTPIDIGKDKKNPADEDTVAKSTGRKRLINGLGPGQTFGTGGLETCIGVIVIDGTTIYVTHISPDDNAKDMLDTLLQGSGEGAIAVVAGGNDDGPSVDQLNTVLAELKREKRHITLHGFADCSGIHVQKDDKGLLQFVRYHSNEMKNGK